MSVQYEETKTANNTMVESEELQELKKASTVYRLSKADDSHCKLEPFLEIERGIRVFIQTIFFIAVVCIIYTDIDHSPYHNLAYCLLVIQILFLIQFIFILASIKHIHFIRVIRKAMPNTRFLIVPYKLKEYPDIAMKSISAISSLRGSNVFGLLGWTMNLTFGMIFAAVSFKWYEVQIRADSDKYASALLLLLLSCFGGGILAHWELEKHKLSVICHYLGALIQFILAPLSFALYQDFSILSAVLMCVTYICIALFGVMMFLTPNKWEDDPNAVHTLSITCITIELIAVCNCMLCAILFVYCMDGDKIL